MHGEATHRVEERMYGSLYNNPYANSNPYAESASSLLPGSAVGDEHQPKNGEDDLQSLNSVFRWVDCLIE